MLTPRKRALAPQLSGRGLAFVLPNGRTLFEHLTLGFGREVTGLVGANGTGKSVLARILVGDLAPTHGHVTRAARLGWLPQNVRLRPGSRVCEALGVHERLAALERLTVGTGTTSDLERVADEWDLPVRVESTLREVGLGHLAWRRPLDTLSGGETTRLSLARIVLSGAEFLVLDEPSNHLDEPSRRWLREWLSTWTGGALIVSHDRTLLEGAQRIAELGRHGIAWHAGGWSSFDRHRAQQRAAASAGLASAAAAQRRARADVQRNRERQARREGRGARKAKSDNAPRVLLGMKKDRSEGTARTLVLRNTQKIDRANARVAEAYAKVEELVPLALSVPSSGLHASAMVAMLHDLRVLANTRSILGPVTLEMRGSARVAVSGINGSGKSTLLRMLAGQGIPASGRLRVGVEKARIAWFDQHARMLDDAETTVSAFLHIARGRDVAFARLALARFGLRGDVALTPVAQLSGGERVRAALCAILHTEPAPQLLLLDEPTNHLDIDSCEVVEEALRAFDGALVVVSHDAVFLDRIGVSQRLTLTPPVATLTTSYV